MLRPVTALVAATAFAMTTALSAGAEPVDVPAGSYKLDPTHASITFKINHLGLSNYTARFKKFDANLTFDPAKPEASKLNVSVDPMSITTDYPFPEQKDFDNKLATDEKFFNAKVHPEITFNATGVEMTGENTAKVTGDLAMLGVTKPVTLDVTLNKGMKEHPFAKKPALGFSGTTKIMRSQFGFDHLIPMVGDEVTLLIEAEFLKE